MKTGKDANTNQCIFCHIHEKARFTRPLFKPYEDLLYIVKKIGPHRKKISPIPPIPIAIPIAIPIPPPIPPPIPITVLMGYI